LSDRRIESELEIKTYDIDVAGHVNNIVYIRWLEDLRCKMFASWCPVSELLERNLYPVVASTQIRYRNSLKLTDKLTGVILLESNRHGLVRLKVTFQRDEEIIATAEQNCVLMNLETGKMVNLWPSPCPVHPQNGGN
jgi:acyl-CoA thioester hydrolase